MAQMTDDHETQPLGDDIEWIDLTPEIERVRPRRSRWTAMLLAGFAAVTGLGLAATNVVPHLTDRASERRDVPAQVEQAPVAGSPGPDPAVAVTGSAAPATPATPVAATSRVERGDGMARVFVGGASVAAGTRITVSLAVGGHTVATENPTPAVTGTGTDVLAPWSADLEVPLGDWPRDAVATLTVAWVDAAGQGGSVSNAIVLGDGRGVVWSQGAGRAH